MDDGGVMESTPRPIIESVVRSVCGRKIDRLVRVTTGGMNETYRVELTNGVHVIVRIARQLVPWFTNEPHAMARAHSVGVPSPAVLGVEHVDHDDELLSFSLLRLVPGRPLSELAGELPAPDFERLVMDAGELVARLHSAIVDADTLSHLSVHELMVPDEDVATRVVSVADQTFGAAAAEVVARGVDRLRDDLTTRPAPTPSLSHGDWLPKHLLVDQGALVSVIDWEFAGLASPALDLAHWELSAGDRLHDQSDLLRRGYARVANPGVADAGWVPAFAINFALEKLAWKNPPRGHSNSVASTSSPATLAATDHISRSKVARCSGGTTYCRDILSQAPRRRKLARPSAKVM